MFSRSAKVLQNVLIKLESFRDFSDLDANLDKTKVIGFLITAVALKFLNSYSLTYGANKLENFKSYKYLGQILSQYGNFNLASQEPEKIAINALYKLRKEMGDHYTENYITNVN